MNESKDIFKQVGRINPLDDDKTYLYSDRFQKFYLEVCTYFMQNSGDSLYGLSMKPYKNDALIAVKVGGIWPLGEETSTSIVDLLDKCTNVIFTPQKGYMVIKFRFKNALETISD